MPETTTAAVLVAPSTIELREFPTPTVGDDDAVMAVECVGICGTDVKLYHAKIEVPFPLLLGHEPLGRIVAAGESFLAKRGLAIGDRVTVASRVPCWACQDCYQGNYRFCQHQRSYGMTTSSEVAPHLWGGFAEHMYLAPGAIVKKVSDDVPAYAAVLIDGVLANGFQWLGNRARIRAGDKVLVQGCGPQGLGAVVAAREFGADFVAITGRGIDKDRLALAKEFGADLTVNVDEQDPKEAVYQALGGRGADVVLDVTGSPQALGASLAAVRRQGTVVVSGISGGGTYPLATDLVVNNELNILGGFSRGAESVAQARRVVESRKYPLERMISHEFGLAEVGHAIEAISGAIDSLYPIKAVVVPR